MATDMLRGLATDVLFDSYLGTEINMDCIKDGRLEKETMEATQKFYDYLNTDYEPNLCEEIQNRIDELSYIWQKSAFAAGLNLGLQIIEKRM